MSDSVFEYLVECAVEEVAAHLVRSEKLSETDALDRIYHSGFYLRLKNRKSGLFGESRASLINLYNKYDSSLGRDTLFVVGDRCRASHGEMM